MIASISLIFLIFCNISLQVFPSPVTLRGRAPLPSVSSFFKHNDYSLTSVQGQNNVKLSSLLTGSKQGYLLLFLTHFADLSSFELAQETLFYLPQIQRQGIRLCAVGPGSLANAEEFCKYTRFPKDLLFVDSSAGLYKELEFNKGFLPSRPLSPYVKLGAMLMGLGSPGTIPEVIRGYLGDRDAPSAWIKESLRIVEQEKFDVLGQNYQRPFELATIRLQNMIDILQHWQSLAPEDTTLLTQLGGAFVFNNEGEVVYEHRDPGILKYVKLTRAVASLGLTLTN